MKLRRYITTFTLTCMAAAMPMLAAASSVDEVRALITAGDYQQARVLAADIETAEGYLLAAESLCAQIMLGEVGKLNKHSKEARNLAKMALELNPNSYEARLQYVLADGFVTRTTGDITAWRKKLPMKTHSAIQSFRADYPQNARAIALDAAWHLGIIRKTGEKNGQKWFGASGVQGAKLYEEAIAIAPQDIVIRTNYVMALLALKTEPDRAALKTELETIMQMAPQSDVEIKIQARAVDVYQNLDDKKLSKRAAERFLDGK